MCSQRCVLTLLSALILFFFVQNIKTGVKKVFFVEQPIVVDKLKIHSSVQQQLVQCKDADECFAQHTSSSGLATVLKDRCSIGNRIDLHTHNLTFTHIPKCGGSSLRHLLSKHFKSRFQQLGPSMGPHAPFFLNQKQFPQNIFFTVLREPTALAISLYNYINMHKSMPQHLMHDKFWLNSYKRDPVEWSSDKYIRKTLRNHILRFFTWYSKSAKYGAGGGGGSTGDFSNAHVWREYLSLPETYHAVLDPWVALSQQQQSSFTNYSLNMPVKYRCSSELKVVLILIQRYSAVGVTEDYDKFFRTLHLRAQLDTDSFLDLMADSGEKKNPSINKISAGKIKTVRSNLNDVLFCSRVLWRLARMIGDHDAACYPSTA